MSSDVREFGSRRTNSGIALSFQASLKQPDRRAQVAGLSIFTRLPSAVAPDS